jgi:hypothetical protein
MQSHHFSVLSLVLVSISLGSAKVSAEPVAPVSSVYAINKIDLFIIGK